jgi:hypothetical protein
VAEIVNHGLPLLSYPTYNSVSRFTIYTEEFRREVMRYVLAEVEPRNLFVVFEIQAKWNSQIT